VAPAATPGPIIARLHAEMQRFQNTPEFRDLLVKYGMEPASPHAPEQFGETIRADVGRWAAVVKASGATID
jgi:tripartite-type tricarboxylate transporter receptor subunit TctC